MNKFNKCCINSTSSRIVFRFFCFFFVNDLFILSGNICTKKKNTNKHAYTHLRWYISEWIGIRLSGTVIKILENYQLNLKTTVNLEIVGACAIIFQHSNSIMHSIYISRERENNTILRPVRRVRPEFILFRCFACNAFFPNAINKLISRWLELAGK